MTDKKSALPFTSAIRILGALGGVCAVVGVVSGVAMLLLKWANGAAPSILTQLAMILVPLALVLLFVVMALSVMRRRAAGSDNSPASTR